MHLLPKPCGYKTCQGKKGSAIEPTGKHCRKTLGRNMKKRQEVKIRIVESGEPILASAESSPILRI